MSKNEQLIEKLSRLTVERGATEAEARAAREKIVVLKAKSVPPNYFSSNYCYSTVHRGKYVEGWPGQKHCEHRTYARCGPYYVCHQCGMEILP